MLKSIGVLPAAALAAACVLLNVRTADACSCAGGPDVRPNTQEAVVPTNTKIWIWTGLGSNDSCETPTLVDDSGANVDVTMSAMEPDIVVLTPTSSLDMSATYSVDCGNDFIAAEFTVSAPEDLVAPAMPTFDVGEYSASDPSGIDMCGPHEWVSLQVTQQGDLMALDIAGRATLEPDAPQGTLVDFALWSGETMRIGQRPCSGTNWNFEEDGAITDVRLGSFDLAGNFSGWSTTQGVDVDALKDDFEADDEGANSDTAGCACSLVQPRNSSGGFALALLALGALTRRRRG